MWPSARGQFRVMVGWGAREGFTEAAMRLGSQNVQLAGVDFGVNKVAALPGSVVHAMHPAAVEQDREQSCARDVAFYHLHERGSIRRTPSRQQADHREITRKADKQCMRAMPKGEALHVSPVLH